MNYLILNSLECISPNNPGGDACTLYVTSGTTRQLSIPFTNTFKRGVKQNINVSLAVSKNASSLVVDLVTLISAFPGHPLYQMVGVFKLNASPSNPSAPFDISPIKASLQLPRGARSRGRYLLWYAVAEQLTPVPPVP